MTEQQRQKLIEQAREQWASDEIEIDNNAQATQSGNDNAYWVQAWVYITTEEA